MTPQLSSAAKYALIAAVSAAGMYWLSGLKERRATGHRLQGRGARARSLIRSVDVSDEVLVERIRAALDRATAHAAAIEVSCSRGVTTLRGAVLKHEHPRVLRAARSAAGGEVHDELAAYKRPDDIRHARGTAAAT